eukprot:498773-Pyramimonas_sp.AAC.1
MEDAEAARKAGLIKVPHLRPPLDPLKTPCRPPTGLIKVPRSTSQTPSKPPLAPCRPPTGLIK